MKLLAWGRPTVIVQSFSNKFFLAGLENGLDVVTTTISNGTAMGDLVGYTVTMKGEEILPANHLNVLFPYGDLQIKTVVGNTATITNV